MRRLLSRPLFLVFHALIMIFAFSPAPSAAGQNVIEGRIAALKPCSRLKTSHMVFGVNVKVGIDKLEYVSFDRAQVVVEGDNVTLSLTGALACRTPDTAMVRGNASVDISAKAEVDLADCKIRSLEVRPTRFGGTFGAALLAAWPGLIAPKIEDGATRMLVRACKDFVGRR